MNGVYDVIEFIREDVCFQIVMDDIGANDVPMYN